MIHRLLVATITALFILGATARADVFDTTLSYVTKSSPPVVAQTVPGCGVNAYWYAGGNCYYDANGNPYPLQAAPSPSVITPPTVTPPLLATPVAPPPQLLRMTPYGFQTSPAPNFYQYTPQYPNYATSGAVIYPPSSTYLYSNTYLYLLR